MLRRNADWHWDDAVIYEGTICSVSEFGVFVAFVDGGKKMEGLVHRSEIPNQVPNADCRSKYTVGEKVKVRILDIDRDDRVKLRGVEFPVKEKATDER